MRSESRWAWSLAALLWSGASVAQLIDPNPDWKETEVPPPPPFGTAGLLPIEMPRYLTLQFGVDPATLRLSNDGLVRYVLVATSPSGPVSATYEAVRCTTGEYKLYARQSGSGQWNAITDPQWQPLRNEQRSRATYMLARQGICDGRAPSGPSAEAIVYRIKHPPQESNR